MGLPYGYRRDHGRRGGSAVAQDEKVPEQEDDDGAERDRFGFLDGRPWYRHPLVILTAAGVILLLLNFYMAATRTAGVPIFG
jgi:hypothetical protein